MPKKTIRLLPKSLKILEEMGSQIRMARLRRNISVSLAAERAGISRTTLWNIEKGDPSVSMGAYCAALHAINGMDKDLLKIASDDKMGKMLQDMQLERLGRPIRTVKDKKAKRTKS